MPLRAEAPILRTGSRWRDLMRVLRIEVLRFWRG